MTMTGLSTSDTRDAARSLRVRVGITEGIVADLDHVAGLSIDTAGARALTVELGEEMELLGDVLDTKATAMELADSGFSTGGTYLMAQLAQMTDELEGSLDDDVGYGASPADVRAYFTQKAYEAAGIDPAQWNPSLGLDANAHIVEQVYEYYADLYRSDPDTLWWAGMAALIGPSFYGGFRDLETFSDLADRAEYIADSLTRIPGVTAPAWMATDFAAGFTEAELRWYQRQLLGMQQEIFLDMAPAHEAFNEGGLLAIEALFEDDAYRFGPQTVAAWAQIDEGRRTGDTALVAEGNATLLLREQVFIIDDDYGRMRDRPLTGDVTTYMMTAIGAPSVPGALGYPDVFPLDIDASRWVGTPKEVTVIPWVYTQAVPHAGGEVTVTVTTPLPDGNIADLGDRWALIEADTLPVYVDLAEHHSDQILDILDTPVGDRADDYTFDERWDDIVIHFATDWDLDLDVDWQAGW